MSDKPTGQRKQNKRSAKEEQSPRKPGGSSKGNRYDYNDEGRGETYSGGARAQKRNKFQEGKKSSNKNVYYIVAIVIAIIGGYFWYSGSSTTGAGASTSSAGPSGSSGARRSSGIFTEAKPENGAVQIPVANFADGKAKFYTYKGSGKEIDFFVLKSSDGVIRAAIDSCDVCYTYKKGYRQEGDEMVCNNCGQRFPSVKINVITGGCNPVALTRTTQGDNVIIKESDILKDNNNLYF